ncbi:hypothetical protein CYMTET_10609 [Cymbomonas tetramitiformis]|uniref:Uncharacterized protein n=1 Tax=Cymbomonas tetramitiformis TaxID=36881 RepID=A0AAE0LEA5_9CHLO|nr:hypothetical protein CYMTET_10609 [Cymbomonas tetramitiformis]
MTANKKTASIQLSLPCEIVKKYPGQEQADLNVKINIPGHWFNDMDAEDRAKEFVSTAVEYSTCRQFGTGRNSAKTEALRFQVEEDVAAQPDHEECVFDSEDGDSA